MRTGKGSGKNWKWTEGFVDGGGEHIKITYGDDSMQVALVAPTGGRAFVVQFVLNLDLSSVGLQQKVLEETRKELDFYLVGKGEKDPWAYAIYHCGTAANIYSPVHWVHYPKGFTGRLSSVFEEKTSNIRKGRRTMRCRVTEEVAYYEPGLNLSWAEGGTWPHKNHYGFAEAVVCSYFILRGYKVLTRYSATGQTEPDFLTKANNRIFREVVGSKIANYLRDEYRAGRLDDRGEPDLFVFRREDNPEDPKIKYADDRTWFFVEAKNEKDRVRETQKRFWRAVAEREDLGMGPSRIRVFRVLPNGARFEPVMTEY